MSEENFKELHDSTTIKITVLRSTNDMTIPLFPVHTPPHNKTIVVVRVGFTSHKCNLMKQSIEFLKKSFHSNNF